MIRMISGLAACFALIACEAQQIGLQAVSPILNESTVRQATSDRQRIMIALHQDASLGQNTFIVDDAGIQKFAPTHSASWYETTLAGFNFVDDQCSTYFSQLFRLERNSRATVSGLGAFAQTANAILTASGKSTLTITSVAQAFGLASSMTEIVSNSFLYQLPPATTREFVSTTMSAYRSAVASEAHTVNNPAIAYSYIRGYLDLCLPVTIEGMLVDTISSTEATAGTASGGRVGIEISSTARSSAALEQPKNTNSPLPAPTSFSPPSDAEMTLSPINIRDIQSFLCFSGNDIDGHIGQKTRIAMQDFFEGFGAPNPAIKNGGITMSEISILLAKIDRHDDGSAKSCTERGNVRTPREVGIRS